MSSIPVKAFISYSWTTVEHSDWVLTLAERLQLSGVHVVIDQWNLEHGQDVQAFMESMVTDPEIKYVLMICDRAYATKADARKGGVGSEAQIISPELYTKTDQTKFIPIVVENDENGLPCLPVFLKSRFFIDFSSPKLAAEEFDTLLRTLYKAPKRPRPPLGAPPAFLSEAPTGIHARILTERTHLELQVSQRPERAGPMLRGLLDTAIVALESLRFEGKGADKELFEFAKTMPELATPVRNAIFESIVALAKAEAPLALGQILHAFFERCIALHHPRPDQNSWNKFWFDPPKLVVMEIFLGIVAILIRYERWGDLDALLDEPYFYTRHREQHTDSFTAFWSYLPLYDEYLNQHVGARKVSYSRELLKESAASSPVQFEELIFADFICFLRWALAEPTSVGGRWIPISIIYLDHFPTPFDLFYRAARSEKYFAKACLLLRVSSRAELAQRFAAAMERHRIHEHQLNYQPLAYARLLNLDELTKVS